jgi:hypothetical protein
MENEIKLGIFMDHASAFLMKLEGKRITTKIINAKFDHYEKEKMLSKSEKLMHQKEHELMSKYYAEIENEIIKYRQIILFGPTEAKYELETILKKNKKFSNLKLQISNCKYLTKTERESLVLAHFHS